MEERERGTGQNRARTEVWERQCSELEEQERKGRSVLLYAKVKQLCKGDRRGKKQESVSNEDGNLLTYPEEIKERWREYIEELYAKTGKLDNFP